MAPQITDTKTCDSSVRGGIRPDQNLQDGESFQNVPRQEAVEQLSEGQLGITVPITTGWMFEKTFLS